MAVAAVLARRLAFIGHWLTSSSSSSSSPSSSSFSHLAQFPRDGSDRISVRSLLRYIVGRVSLEHFRVRLSAYDNAGGGFLTEHDLEMYVFESIPEAPDLAALQENFYPFYVFTAVRKILFFLDPHRTGRVKIIDLVASRVMAEWLQLLPPFITPPPPSTQSVDASSGESGQHDASGGEATIERTARALLRSSLLAGHAHHSAHSAAAPEGDDSSSAAAAGFDLSDSHESAEHGQVLSSSGVGAGSGGGSGGGGGSFPAPASNWFSAANALRLYSTYLELDADQNGMLSAAELAAWHGGSLTPAFVTRLFQEVHTYGGEMDYKAFLDFVLACEYRSSWPALRYTFRVLDLHRNGSLSLDVLRYFLRDVAARMAEAADAARSGETSSSSHPQGASLLLMILPGLADCEPLNIANVCDEIYDMVRPANPAGGITLEDLKASRVGHTVLHILTDVAGYWAYDNREQLMQQQQQAQSSSAQAAAAAAGGMDSNGSGSIDGSDGHHQMEPLPAEGQGRDGNDAAEAPR